MVFCFFDAADAAESSDSRLIDIFYLRRCLSGGQGHGADASTTQQPETYLDCKSYCLTPAYLGTAQTDEGCDVAVDAAGNAYVTGRTNSANAFPTGTYPQYGYGGFDAFVTKLDPNGALLYSTYLGSSGTDEGYGIALDADRNAYVTGRTNSASGFPTGTALLYGHGGFDAFVVKLDPAAVVAYSSYLGATETDEGCALALDDARNAFVTGRTNSVSGFPSPLYGYGGFDAFVTKLDARQPAPVAGSAARDVDASDTTLSLNDISRFPERGEIQIDGERMTYDGKRPASQATVTTGSDAAAVVIPGELLNVQRGAAGTTPAPHQAGAAVVLLSNIVVGDCDANKAVTVDELVIGVNIVLGNLASAACPSFDADADGGVTVDELLWAIANALGGA